MKYFNQLGTIAFKKDFIREKIFWDKSDLVVGYWLALVPEHLRSVAEAMTKKVFWRCFTRRTEIVGYFATQMSLEIFVSDLCNEIDYQISRGVF